MVNFTIKSSDVDGFGSLKLPIEKGKLTKTSLGRHGLLARNTLLLVTLSIHSQREHALYVLHDVIV